MGNKEISVRMGNKGLETFITKNSDENIAQDINICNEIAKWRR